MSIRIATSLLFFLFASQTQADAPADLTCDQAKEKAAVMTAKVSKWNSGEGQDVPFKDLKKFTFECHTHRDWEDETQERNNNVRSAGSFELNYRNLRQHLRGLKDISRAFSVAACGTREDVRAVNHEFTKTLLQTSEIVKEHGLKLARDTLQLSGRRFAEASHTAIAGVTLANGTCVTLGGACGPLDVATRDLTIRQLTWYFEEIRDSHNYWITPEVLATLVRQANLLGVDLYNESDITRAWSFNVRMKYDGQKISTSSSDPDRFSYTTQHEALMSYHMTPKMTEEDPGFRFLINEAEMNFVTLPASGSGSQGRCVQLKLNTEAFQSLINLKPDFCAVADPGMIWTSSNLAPHSSYEENETWSFNDTCKGESRDQIIPFGTMTMTFLLMKTSRNPYVYPEEEGRPLHSFLIPLPRLQKGIHEHTISGVNIPIKGILTFDLVHQPQ